MDDVVDLLIAAIDASGYKHNWIAREARMAPGKFSKIYHRRQIPNVYEYGNIARAIGRDPQRLLANDEIVVNLSELRGVNAAMQGAIQTLTSWLPEQPRIASRTAPATPLSKPDARREGPVVDAAANSNAELLVEYQPERGDIPRDAWNAGARMTARVRGDSMDGGPDPIRDGELAYLKPTRSPATANGKVTLVRHGEALYLKVFEKSGRTIRLVSANRTAHGDIVIDARAESVQVYGTVVGHRRAP
jgi:phage repressor protein C with HTH and peptisase S24 domain